MRPYRGKAILSAITLVIGTAIGLVSPFAAKFAIDRGIVPGDRRALIFWTVAFVVAALLGWVAAVAQTYLSAWVGQRVLADLRRDLFAHIQTLELGYFERNRAGWLISRLTNDVDALEELVTDGLYSSVQNTLLLFGTAGMLLYLDWRLALATLTVFPLMALATTLFRIYSARAYRRMRERLADVTATLAEDLAGARVVQSFRRERGNAEAFGEISDGYRRANYRTVQLNAWYFPFVGAARLGLDGDRAGLRRRPLLRRRDHDRHAVRVHALPVQLLRSDPGALAALQHVPRGERGARQDLRRHGHGARAARRARRAAAAADRGRRRAVGRSFPLRPGRRGAARHRPHGRRRPDRGARRSHRRGQVDARQAAGALLRPDVGRDPHRRPRPARRPGALAARAARHRPAGGLPVRRLDPREHRLRPARCVVRGRAGRRPRRRRGRRSSKRSPRATRRPWPSAAPRSRSASAS